MVERVVLLPTELEPGPLSNLEFFIDGRVEVPTARTVVGIAHALRVKCTVRRRGPYCSAGRGLGLEVVVVVGGGIAALRVLVGDLNRRVLHPVLSDTGGSNSGVIGGGTDGERRSALVDVNAADGPAAKGGFDKTAARFLKKGNS